MLRIVLCCALVATAASRPQSLSNQDRFFLANDPRYQLENQGQDIPILKAESFVEEDGSASFSYETGNGIYEERTVAQKPVGDEGATANVITGFFQYPDENGNIVKQRYIADELGFRLIDDE